MGSKALSLYRVPLDVEETPTIGLSWGALLSRRRSPVVPGVRAGTSPTPSPGRWSARCMLLPAERATLALAVRCAQGHSARAVQTAPLQRGSAPQGLVGKRARLVSVVRLAAGERGSVEAFHLALLRCLPLRAGMAQTAQSGVPVGTRPDAGR